MIVFIVYGDCPIERTGFHRFLVHVTNGDRRPGHGAIYGIGRANCPIKAAHRAVVDRLRWMRRHTRTLAALDAARHLPLWRATA